jgi:hypothetical protein
MHISDADIAVENAGGSKPEIAKEWVHSAGTHASEWIGWPIMKPKLLPPTPNALANKGSPDDDKSWARTRMMLAAT